MGFSGIRRNSKMRFSIELELRIGKWRLRVKLSRR